MLNVISCKKRGHIKLMNMKVLYMKFVQMSVVKMVMIPEVDKQNKIENSDNVSKQSDPLGGFR